MMNEPDVVDTVAEHKPLQRITPEMVRRMGERGERNQAAIRRYHRTRRERESLRGLIRWLRSWWGSGR